MNASEVHAPDPLNRDIKRAGPDSWLQGDENECSLELLGHSGWSGGTVVSPPL